MSAESNNRPQEALRLCPSIRKTWHVFRITTNTLVDQVHEGADKWRRIPHLPGNHDRHRWRWINLQRLYNDTWRKQRAHRIRQQRKSQSFLNETQVTEHVIRTGYGVHANARLAVKRGDRIVQRRGKRAVHRDARKVIQEFGRNTLAVSKRMMRRKHHNDLLCQEFADIQFVGLNRATHKSNIEDRKSV